MNGVSMNETSLQLEKCYLDSTKIVVNHNIQKELLLTSGSFFKQMALNYGAEIKINSVGDDAAPEVPRVTIIAKEILFHFGLNRMEAEIKGIRKHVRKEGIFEVYKHYLKDIESLITNYLSKLDGKEGFTGIVAPVRFPQIEAITKEALIKRLYEILTGKNNSELAAFSVKIGLKISDMYVNYEISDYEVKNVSLQPSLNPQSIAVNLEDFPTVEKGVLVVVDVNNKLQLNHQFSVDYPNLIDNFFKAIGTFEKILLKGAIV